MNLDPHPNHPVARPRSSRAHLPVVMMLALACGGAGAQTAPAAPAAASAASAPAGPTVRAEIAKPVQAAQELIRTKNGAQALLKLAEAEAVPALTSYERYVIVRTRAVAALDAGDPALALLNFERTLGSEHLPAADRRALMEAVARLAIQTKDHERALTWLGRYKDAGGPDAALRRALPQLMAERGDHAGAVREAFELVRADESAGRGSAEALLRNLAFSQGKLGDTAGYVATLERLAQQYPKTDYWIELINRVAGKPGFAGDRLRLDVYRFFRAIGIALEPDEITEYSQRALQAGLPAEAQAVLDEAHAAGTLGKGKGGADQVKLREQATKSAAQDRATLADSEKAALAAKDGNALVGLGMALSGAGVHDKALALTEQGIAKGGLRRPDEALLHQGIVQWRAGRKDDALRSFNAAKGVDGSGDLARLWALYVGSAKPR